MWVSLSGSDFQQSGNLSIAFLKKTEASLLFSESSSTPDGVLLKPVRNDFGHQLENTRD